MSQENQTIHYIDVANMSSEEAEAHLETIRQKYAQNRKFK